MDQSARPDKYADSCYNDQDHDNADLCAQWRAAIAAEKSAESSDSANNFAAAGALLSFISIVLVFIALRQTERSLGQTRDANDIARASARPWLSIEVVKMKIDYGNGMAANGTIKIANCGGRPAEELMCGVNILPGDWTQRFEDIVRIPSLQSMGGAIAPGQTMERQVGGATNGPIDLRHTGWGAFISIFAEYKWEDQKCVTLTVYHFHREGLISKGSLSLADAHLYVFRGYMR